MKENQYSSLVTSKENAYFILMLIASSMTYLLLTFSIVGIIFIFIMFLIATITHGLFIGNIRANGVKLGPHQFQEVYEKAVEISQNMGLKKVPDIYVIESSGILNALATRFFGKNVVVLYSGIFELIKNEQYDEVHFVLAHELAHIKRNHILKSMLLLPMNFIPFLSEAYSRACEYTCDRMAAFYIQNTQAAVNSLVLLSIGTELYDRVNKEEYIRQLENENGLFVWLSEKLSTHPPLPKRIYALEAFFEERPYVRFKSPILKLIGASFLTALLFVGILVGSYQLFNIFQTNFSQVFAAEEDVWMEFEYENELEQAYYEDDLEWTKQLLEEGADPSIVLSNSNETLVHLAIANGEPHFVELYLHYTDSNIMNGNGEGLLHYAGYYGYYDMIPVLIDLGADVNDIDDQGNTPLLAATMNGSAPPDILQYMLDHGADPLMPNANGLSPLTYAKNKQLNEIVKLYEYYLYQ